MGDDSFKSQTAVVEFEGELRANVCKNRATGSHGQKFNFAHILSIHTY